LGLNLQGGAGAKEALERRKFDELWERWLSCDPALKALVDGLNLEPPRFILGPVCESVFGIVV
jgi:hypothetical protein